MIHGKSSTYRAGGCRCENCREANTIRQRQTSFMASEKFAAGLVEVEHGKANTYRYYGCRCDECKAAHVTECRRWKERKKEGAVAGAVTTAAVAATPTDNTRMESHA